MRALHITAIISRDPFQQHGLAMYRVIGFSPVKSHSALKDVV